MKLNQSQNIFHVIVNVNSIVQYVIQIKNGIMKRINVNVKIIMQAKKVIVNSKYLKNTSVTECD